MGCSKNDQKPYHTKKIENLLNENINRFDQKACSLKKIDELVKENLNRFDQKAYSLKKIDKLSKENINRFAHEDATATRFKDFITNEMNGNDIKLVCKMKLYANHLFRNQNTKRSSVPIRQLETHELLAEFERRDLECVKELEVRLLGPRFKMHDKPLMMKIWRVKATNENVLESNWNDFAKDNDEVLKENPMIHLWSFRGDGKQCYALACIDDVA